MSFAAANSAQRRQSLCPHPRCCGQLLRREVRVQDERGRAGGKRRERLVEFRIAELVICRVNEIAGDAANAIRERAAGMIERQRRDLESRNVQFPILHAARPADGSGGADTARGRTGSGT